MPKTRKFIDKNNSRTFHVVHRSQKDPLTADENAPQRVLVEATSSQKRKETLAEYGIYYEDDYNYLQHLKDVNHTSLQTELVEDPTQPQPKSNLRLPASVFQSGVEEKVGLLNKAAPQSGLRLDLDPDIVYALENASDCSDMEDDFIQLAEGGSHAKDGDEGDCSDIDSDEARDEVMSMRSMDYSFAAEETKSRFTEYSMSSCSMRRNSQLTLLDDKFENMYKEYDEDKMGALDCEDIEGTYDMDSQVMKQCLSEYEKSLLQDVCNVSELVKDRLKIMPDECSDSEEDADSKLTKIYAERDETDKWDCETILSTYSNIYNHPKKIVEQKLSKIAIDRRTGIPAVKNHHRESESEDTSSSDDEDDNVTVSSVQFTRSKHETAEEKKERKKQVKLMKKVRRKQKKISKEMFKEETKKEQKVLINKNKTANEIRIA